MESLETIKNFLGKIDIAAVITTIATIATILAIANHVFNLRDRFKKWAKDKKDNKLKKDAPNFQFTFNYVSNSEPGKCFLHSTVLNLSKEIKYFDSISYVFRFKNNPNTFIPPTLYVNGDKWPKRLEHGERFYAKVEFSNSILIGLFDYWQKGVEVYATCNSTTGDRLQSNALEFDKLVDFLQPINEEYSELSNRLSNLTGGSQRDIEASLWQLQIYERLTVHIVKQFHFSNIPIVKFLLEKHGLELKQDPWYHWYYDLEAKKIPSQPIVDFLDGLKLSPNHE